MLTGPRRGEISALRWRYVDLDRGLLTITRSNGQPKTGLEEKHTKAGQARKIALDKQHRGTPSNYWQNTGPLGRPHRPGA
jgi:integrase